MKKFTFYSLVLVATIYAMKFFSAFILATLGAQIIG